MSIIKTVTVSHDCTNSNIIFPVYKYLKIQIRGGACTQDDRCQMEVDLAERFRYEVQVQVSDIIIVAVCMCWNGLFCC